MTGLVRTMRVNVTRVEAQATDGFTLATEIADWLAAQGTPFREAHEVTGHVVRACEDAGCGLRDLTANTLSAIDPRLAAMPDDILNPRAAIARRCGKGGPPPTGFASNWPRCRRVPGGCAMIDTSVLRLRVVRDRHPGRWVSAAAILVAFALVVGAFAMGQIEWSIVGQFLTMPAILNGLMNTVLMTACAMALGITLGVVFAVMYLSPNPVLRASALFYIWFFRGTPLLLQLLLWFNLALVFPAIGISGLFEARMVDVMTPFVATLLGLGMNQGAYTAEVVRGGILSVDQGQTEAARSIGMTRLKTLRRIVLPQAMRVIIPPVGNEFISMVKLTSIASVIQYSEILRNAQTIYYANARVIELLIVAAIWYLAVVTVLQTGQFFLERHFAKGRSTTPARATGGDLR